MDNRAKWCVLPLLAVVGTAFGSDMPKRKSGLWEMKTASPMMQGRDMTMQMCIDQATDDAARLTGEQMGRQQCSRMEFRREGPQRFVSEAVCKVEGTTMAMRSVFSGDFSSAYKGEITTRYDPPAMGRAEDRMTIEARWLGPCKPGMKPGDMVLPGGMTIPGGMKPPAGMPRQ